VLRPGTFNLSALHALPVKTVVAGANTFTGVSFWDLLDTTAGLAIDPAVKNDVLGMCVVAVGSDGYNSVFSLGEINPLFGNELDLVAYSIDGQPLGGNGFARIVAPTDIARGRFVSNLVSLEIYHVVAAVPEPETLSLIVLGWCPWRPFGGEASVRTAQGARHCPSFG
jgi:hypothetical protein